MACRNGNHCCCERCKTVRLDCDACCKCVPIALCAVIRDEYGETRAGAKLTRSGTTYSGTLTCNGESVSITVESLQDVYGDCWWHVVVEDDYGIIIEDWVPISTDYGGQSCSQPEFRYESPFAYCGGELIIERFEKEPLPFVRAESGCWEPFCGNCYCVCQTLCVTRVINGETQPVEELAWDPDASQWGTGYDAIGLARDDETGECLILVPGFDPVVVGDCESAASSVDDGYGNSVSGHCKQCTCDEEDERIPCGPIPLPRVLTATIENVEGCGNADGVSFDIEVIGPAGGCWAGDVLVNVPYQADPCTVHFGMVCGESPAGSTSASPCVTTPDIVAEVLSLDPFEAIFETTTSGSPVRIGCCEAAGPDSAVRFRVTEG